MEPKFIQFGGTRIKLSNIKNYGISYEAYEVKRPPTQTEINRGIKRAEDRKKKRKKWDILGKFVDEVDVAYLSSNYYKEERSRPENKKQYYLYVTTYQNDNYKFYEDEVSFNIRDKVKELDKYLT